MYLTRAGLNVIDLEQFRPLAPNPTEFFDRREHYRLLAYLSMAVADRSIIDIGTNYGASALALTYSYSEVHSFDVERRTRPDHPTIRYYIEDLWDPAVRAKREKLLLDSSLIFIDIDPHEGTREYEFVRWLQANGYRGIIVLDDIWYFKPMRDNLWYHIEPCFRTDLTEIGHWSGTGIVSFGERVVFEERDNSNWTLVTGYFDLTKAPDANDAIRARPAEHYIDQYGASTLALDKNLVVFCDPELEPKIWSMRPSWLHDRTKVVAMSFEDFPITRLREQIIANRGGVSGCTVDPRNTASYYLFCMARYAMLKQIIASNPFGSTHFAWINICIERMGFNNLVHLDEALSLRRDKFSTCFIDYIPRETVEDLPKYFGHGGCQHCRASCSMCSGFFTGNAFHMNEVCGHLENEFMRCLELGYGHADEQLYPIVYFKHPELFDWYVGDYSEMITNYAGVYEHPERPIGHLIRHSLESKDYEVCERACRIVLESYARGKCTLSLADYAAVSNAMEICP